MITHQKANDIKYKAIPYRAFSISFLGLTNHSPSRIKIKDNLWGDSRIISFPSGRDTPHLAAELGIAFLTELDIDIAARAETEDSYILLSTNFDIRITKDK